MKNAASGEPIVMTFGELHRVVLHCSKRYEVRIGHDPSGFSIALTQAGGIFPVNLLSDKDGNTIYYRVWSDVEAAANKLATYLSAQPAGCDWFKFNS